ncbi:cytochrome P450 monooxygenase fum15 [Colletotrichum spaethianum]|uniref:Cytochrome P450 monooxygenase fum15 n=1 Tax=Colletotrichum spaethianum TaxID=700344 RepID=A0AA37UPZ2_9PEZI|nr:cytochrome P450 monooxygenase fum15 [Colletotrichum spaethianum]GKT47882.1 cytochrome P450 monooxygenase fum15 [Colletotrichum spaethianum]
MSVDVSLYVPILLHVTVLAAFRYILIPLWVYWRRPYSPAIARFRGPPIKHWFFGFLTPSEIECFEMSTKLLELCDDYDGDPEAISYVLNNSQTYVRAEVQMRVARMLFGDGLVAVDGEQHRRQRKVIGPALTSAAVEGMAAIFYEKSHILADRWTQKLPSTANQETKCMEINAYREFEALSLDIIGTAGFQHDFHSLSGQRSELEDALVNVAKSAATGSIYSSLRSHFNWFGTLGSLFSQEQKTLDKYKRHVRRISKDLVENAKRRIQMQDGDETARARDILSLIVKSNISTTGGARLDDDEVVSMVPTFLLGGYDNNASEMSYALFALTNFPETQRRLRKELICPPPDNRDWQENFRSLERLPYLDAIAKETFRMYSSAHSIPRTVSRDDCIPLSRSRQLRDGSWVDKIHLSRGDDVVIAQKWVNVSSRFWGPTAHLFRPERWIEDPEHEYYDGGLPRTVTGDGEKARKELPGWSHLMTFSIGPRSCPGYKMAVAEFKVSLAILVLRFMFIRHKAMDEVYGEVQVVDRPRVKGKEGYCMPCWVKALD